LSFTIPVAKVEFIDENSNVYTLSPCYQFKITLRRDTPLSRFSISVARASLWNARTSSYFDLLTADVRKRVKIYIGTRQGDSYSYDLFYTGIPFKVAETYMFGQTEVIRIEGFNLGYLLQRTDGAYSSTTYTGYSKGLIQYWCDEAGITYDLSYSDTIYMDSVTIAYNNALAGILDILKVLGPNVESYFTTSGQLVIADASFWSEESNELELDQDSIISLSRYQELHNVITRAVIVGKDTDSSTSVDADSSLINVYGLNKKTIASGLITSLSQAESLAAAILWHGERFTDMAEVVVELNTSISTYTLMSIADSSLSATVKGQLRPDEVVHSFRYGQKYETKISGFFDEGSSSSSSSSSSSNSSSSSSSSSSSVSSSSSSNSSSSSSLSSSSSNSSSSSSSNSSSSSSSSLSSSSLSSSSNSLSSSSSSLSSVSSSSSSSSFSSSSSSSLSSSSSSSSVSLSSSSSCSSSKSSSSQSSSCSSSSSNSVAECWADDEFTGEDGTSPAGWKWTESDLDNDIMSIQDNEVRIAKTESSGSLAELWSNWEIAADGAFDIQIDFSNLSASGDGGVTFSFSVLDVDESWVLAKIGIEKINASHRYFATDLDSTSENVNTSDTSGKLRIVGDGTNVKVYYWSGSQWEWDGNTSGLQMSQDFSGYDLFVFVEVYSTVYSGSLTYRIDLDNFVVNSGCNNISLISSSSSSRSSSSSSQGSSSSSSRSVSSSSFSSSSSSVSSSSSSSISSSSSSSSLSSSSSSISVSSSSSSEAPM